MAAMLLPAAFSACREGEGDLDTWLRLGLCGPFVRIPETLAIWRSHTGSITVAERTRARADEYLAIARTFFSRDDLPARIRALRRQTMSRAWWLAAWVLADTEPFRAKLCLLNSYRLARHDRYDLPADYRRFPCPSLPGVLRWGRRSLGQRMGSLSRPGGWGGGS
jgi:hypothetical protein